MKHLFGLLLAFITCSALGGTTIATSEAGSGTPGSVATPALPILANDIYHAPQYLPFYPTAATIWPRVVEVDCESTVSGLKCDGYNWAPRMGRGEYLFFTPRLKAPVIYVPVTKEITVLKEVPAKKPNE